MVASPRCTISQTVRLIKNQSLLMQGKGPEDIQRGPPKILSSERGATKILKSEKGAMETEQS